MSGPTTPPRRKALANTEETRPRIVGGASRMMSAAEETVNIVEPMPPRDRKTMSCS